LLKEPAIPVENLIKHCGTLLPANHLSFNVNKGEVFGFLGPNGAGKTTTVRTLHFFKLILKGGNHGSDI
jgi:ABC-2 type transport system ATP-binding protein